MKPFVFEDLKTALDTFDWSQAEKLCNDLIAVVDAATAPYDEAQAKKILNALRRKRQFKLMGDVADALINAGQSAPQIRRQYAQSMIDRGNLAAARDMLQMILNDANSPPEETAEAQGLMGRVYKQLYVNANDSAHPRQQENLRKAIAYYYGVYKSEPRKYLWHGINTAALLARAKRDDVSVPFPAQAGIAQELEGFLKELPSLEYWDRATAIEDAVALGNANAAYEHALHYALDEKADAFEIASLLRQLKEVWQLAPEAEPGNTLLPILQAALLKRAGGGLTVDARTIPAAASNAGNARLGLEKVFGAGRFEHLDWLRTALRRCEAVGRVQSIAGAPIGTGFLVMAVDFFPDFPKGKMLFLTNAHVVPGDIAPEAAKVVFEANGSEYKVEKKVWSSPYERLDATFLSLKDFCNQGEYCPLEPPAAGFDGTQKQRVYVIGYPGGRGLSISLQESFWLDANPRHLLYRTPTEPGSSGSPVFDQEFWTLIGLHHRGCKDMQKLDGKGTYEANEGIAIGEIQRDTRRSNTKCA